MRSADKFLRAGGVVPALVVAVILALCLSLGGCGSTFTPLYSAIVNEAGEVVPDIVGHVKDASVSKESMVHTSLMFREAEYTKRYEQQGVTITETPHQVAETTTIVLPDGQTVSVTTNRVITLTTTTVKAPPTMLPMPLKPSESPWVKFASDVAGGFWSTLKMGLGMYFFADYGKHSIDAAKTDYSGAFGDYSFAGPGALSPVTTTTTTMPGLEMMP